MKLDIDYLQYITKDEILIMIAIEKGMSNHEWVPVTLIEKLSHLKRGVVHKVLRGIGKQKLIDHTMKNYEGFKLNYLGYDYLALYTFLRRGQIRQIHYKIGCGKESDIYLCEDPKGQEMVLKLTRLGRTSFKSVRQNRDYLKGKTQFNWLYLSRLSSLKEFLFMQALHANGFPTPKPIDSNRHAILMSRIPGVPVCKCKVLKNPSDVYNQAMNMVKDLARNGLIHCDFNEFNLMIGPEEKLTVIDFPQMVSTAHVNAETYFQRDVECVKVMFWRKYKFCNKDELNISVYDYPADKRLDHEIQASGFGNDKEDKSDMKMFDILEEVYAAERGHGAEGEEEDYDEDQESDNDESRGSEADESDEDPCEDAGEDVDAGELPEKRVKKNSTTMDPEEMITEEKSEQPALDGEDKEGQEKLGDAESDGEDGDKKMRLEEIKGAKADKAIGKVIKKKFKKRFAKKKNPNKPKDLRDMNQNRVGVEIVD
jgi:RIO kinase 2